LPIGNAVDEGVAGEAAQVAEKAVAGVEIAGEDQDEPGVVE